MAPRRIVFAPGTVIFAEGDVGTTAFVVEIGKVRIYKTRDGREIEIGEVGRSGIFGEMALIDDQPRMATAEAVTETTCVLIPKDRLAGQLDLAPKGVKVIVNALLGNIRAMGAELAEAALLLAQYDKKP
ncbi:cyclic nucleotide-binding domain-containing protein [Magnetospirillum molischianum]|uniref:Putative cAMP-binding protein-catabolite gene activator and regulatory subunit of cAMP-dependent protein kinase n=1 Tax=Magnetospirillum molischianum DSM 120 TaxID=1150626 RepID=H8FTI4_MAGML|nr:cyclic nucleotide-binding domain-containing protein [Magnetospirillum molischianum]CCG41672.1 Putative cAMP-binding protein-catabolite gene activator and regulatory subunit of cAMP-dependent protein kinase [Magnetospirillum molischianum DSM 120]